MDKFSKIIENILFAVLALCVLVFTYFIVVMAIYVTKALITGMPLC